MADTHERLSDADTALVAALLAVDTQTPMETGRPGDLAQAQNLLAAAAARLGFRQRYWQAPPAEVLDRADTPVQVRQRAAAMGAARFLAAQPNLVLQLGPARAAARTLTFNCHLDTVSGLPPAGQRGGIIYGRGAVDVKGQAVAVLAGVRQALAAQPALTERITVLLHGVGGEEGGAMGCYGTRVVAEAGYTGRLNVVVEPTLLAALDRTTASMTASVEVDGEGAADDAPTAGHNATIALAVLTEHLARTLSPEVAAAGGTMCVAGLRTGEAHNRVYGTGRLLVNFAYGDQATGIRIRELTERCFAAAVGRLHADYRGLPVAARVAADARAVCRMSWLKAGLPVLHNRDAAMEAVLARAGIPRAAGDRPVAPFTCDAMWLQAAGQYTVVFGAGDLAANGAHTDREHMALNELAACAAAAGRLIVSFADAAGDCGRGAP